jgi:hypothetical protein
VLPPAEPRTRASAVNYSPLSNPRKPRQVSEMINTKALSPASLQRLHEHEQQQQQQAEPLPMRLHKHRAGASAASQERQPGSQELRASGSFQAPEQQAALRASLQSLDLNRQQQGSRAFSEGSAAPHTTSGPGVGIIGLQLPSAPAGSGTPVVFGAKLSASMGHHPLAQAEAPQVSGYAQQQQQQWQPEGQQQQQQPQWQPEGQQPAPAFHRAGPLFSEAPAYEGAMLLEQQLYVPQPQQAAQQQLQPDPAQPLRQSAHMPVYQAMSAAEVQPQAWQPQQQPAHQQQQMPASAFPLPAAPPPAHPAYAAPAPAQAAPQPAPAWQPAQAPPPAAARSAPASPLPAQAPQVTITFSQPGGSQVQLQLPAPPASPTPAQAQAQAQAASEELQGAWPMLGRSSAPPRASIATASIMGGLAGSEQQSLDSTAASMAVGNMMAMLARQQPGGEAPRLSCLGLPGRSSRCHWALSAHPRPSPPTHPLPRPQAWAAACRTRPRCTAATSPLWTATRPTRAAPTSAPPACPPTASCR